MRLWRSPTISYQVPRSRLPPGVLEFEGVPRLRERAAEHRLDSHARHVRAEAHANHPMAKDFIRGLATAWARQAPDELLDWLEASGQPEATKAAALAKLATL